MSHLVRLSLALCFTSIAWASDPFLHNFADHVVHYNVFNSSALSAEIANQYGLKRGAKIDTLNIAVQLKTDTGMQPVDALLKGTVTNFYQQQQHLEFLRVQEGDYIYFLAQFRVTDETPLYFQVYIRPGDYQRTYELKFKRPIQ